MTAAVATSYLAVPFVDSRDQAIAILYAEGTQRNLFANDDLLTDIMAQCDSFCRVLDELIAHPLDGIRHYRLEPDVPVIDQETVYPKLQEVVDFRQELTQHFHFGLARFRSK